MTLPALLMPSTTLLLAATVVADFGFGFGSGTAFFGAFRLFAHTAAHEKRAQPSAPSPGSHCSPSPSTEKAVPSRCATAMGGRPHPGSPRGSRHRPSVRPPRDLNSSVTYQELSDRGTSTGSDSILAESSGILVNIAGSSSGKSAVGP
ncbi:hypothetical protein SHO565_64230 [Streptomyces sp. HO565]